MSAEPPVFVDTNVLVYAYDEAETERQTIAEGLIADLLDSDRLRLSTQVLQEFYVTMTRKVARPLEPTAVLRLLDDFAVWIAISVDYSVIREAVELSVEATLAFWDALIVVAAKHSGAGTLYSEDLNDGQVISGVRVINPFVK